MASTSASPTWLKLSILLLLGRCATGFRGLARRRGHLFGLRLRSSIGFGGDVVSRTLLLLNNDLQIDYSDVTRLPLDSEGDYCHCIPADFTVEQTAEKLRALRTLEELPAGNRDALFVVELDGRLLGELSCFELLTSAGNSTIREITREPEVILLEEQVRRGDAWAITDLRESEGYLAPFVSEDGRLTRVMSTEDALMALTEGYEPQDENMEEPEQEGYFSTSIVKSTFARTRWLVTLLMLQSVSSLILKAYEDTLSQHFVLALFLTMITGTAGNAGNQSTSVIIRGLATGEIGRKQILSVLWREFWAGLSMGCVLGLVAFGRVMACAGSTPLDALVVAGSLAMTVLAGVLMGSASPLILKRFGVDPANSASPILATFMDVSGVFVLCVAGKLFLSTA